MVLGTKERIVADRQFSTERYILSTNPVLYLPLYRLDGTSFRSADGVGHTCTVTGASWTPQGRSYDAVPDDYITCGDLTRFQFSGDFTAWAWVSMPALPGAASYPRIFCKQDTVSPYPGWFLRLQATTGYWLFSLTDSAANNMGASYAVPPTLNTSYFVAGVRSGSTANIYINGNIVGTATNALVGSVAAVGYPLYVGSNRSAADRWTGYIKEAGLNSRALTPLEIQNIFLATKWRYQ